MLISLFFNATNKIKSVSCLPSYKINLKERIHFSYCIKLIAPLDLMKTSSRRNVNIPTENHLTESSTYEKNV